MNLLKFFVLPSVAAAVICSSGCAGYQLGAIKPTKMAHIKSIAVPTFKNETLEPRAQVLVTNELIKFLQRDGSYVIGDLSSADAIFNGTIRTIERRQLRSSRTDSLRTSEMEFILTVDFVVEDAETGAELERGTASGRTSIYLDPNFQLSERQALQQAAERVGMRLASRLSEGY